MVVPQHGSWNWCGFYEIPLAVRSPRLTKNWELEDNQPSRGKSEKPARNSTMFPNLPAGPRGVGADVRKDTQRLCP